MKSGLVPLPPISDDYMQARRALPPKNDVSPELAIRRAREKMALSLSDDAALEQYLSRGRSRRKTTPEGGVLRAICEYLTIKGILWFRMNSGQRIVNYPDGRRYAIKMQRKGTADLLAFLPWEITDTAGHKHTVPFPLWIEVKAPGKLNKCSRDQQAFAIEVVARGHIHCVADSVDAVIKLIEGEKPWKSGR